MIQQSQRFLKFLKLTLMLSLSLSITSSAWGKTSPQEILSQYEEQAKTKGNADRGRVFFTQTHGREWSCASCHTAMPTRAHKHILTGKPISALAPSADPDRFTDAAFTEKWFRRNCRDVLGRECSASEKADVMVWLMGLK